MKKRVNSTIKIRAAIALLSLFINAPGVIAGPTMNSFTAGTTIQSALVNANFSALSNAINNYSLTAPTGILGVANGGTGSSTGSITGTGALTFTAGGTNQNLVLTPSGSGYTLLNGNVGIGTSTPNATLAVNGGMSTNVNAITSDYTLTSSDSIVTVDASSSALTITLPSPGGREGIQYTIKKIDSSANEVTIVPASGTIDGQSSFLLVNQYNFLRVISDGSNWNFVGASGGALAQVSNTCAYSTVCTATCPAGKYAVGGGCTLSAWSYFTNSSDNGTASSTSWYCESQTSGANVTVTVQCR